jgi:hypothetical protein
MKFRFPLLATLAFALYSCSSDDYEPSIELELPAEGSSRVRSITHEGSLPYVYDWKLNYNDKYLVAAEGNLVGDTENMYSSYLSYTPETVLINNPKGPQMEAIMDADGNIVQLTVSKDVYNFVYTNGYLTAWDKTVRDMNFGGNVSSASGKLKYSAGNLVRIEYVENNGNPTIITLTPSTTLNKNGLLPVTLSLQMGCFGFEHLYYGGMLGKASKNLVKRVVVDDPKGTANDFAIDYTYSVSATTGDTELCVFTYRGQAATAIYKY